MRLLNLTGFIMLGLVATLLVGVGAQLEPAEPTRAAQEIGAAAIGLTVNLCGSTQC